MARRNQNARSEAGWWSWWLRRGEAYARRADRIDGVLGKERRALERIRKREGSDVIRRAPPGDGQAKGREPGKGDRAARQASRKVARKDGTGGQEGRRGAQGKP